MASAPNSPKAATTSSSAPTNFSRPMRTSQAEIVYEEDSSDYSDDDYHSEAVDDDDDIKITAQPRDRPRIAELEDQVRRLTITASETADKLSRFESQQRHGGHTHTMTPPSSGPDSSPPPRIRPSRAAATATTTATTTAAAQRSPPQQRQQPPPQQQLQQQQAVFGAAGSRASSISNSIASFWRGIPSARQSTTSRSSSGSSSTVSSASTSTSTTTARSASTAATDIPSDPYHGHDDDDTCPDTHGHHDYYHDPATVAALIAKTTQLEHKLATEQSLRHSAETQLKALSTELEDLSAALFTHANEMVAAERREKAALEERVRILQIRDDVRTARLVALESAVATITHVRSVLTPATAPAAVES